MIASNNELQIRIYSVHDEKKSEVERGGREIFVFILFSPMRRLCTFRKQQGEMYGREKKNELCVSDDEELSPRTKRQSSVKNASDADRRGVRTAHRRVAPLGTSVKYHSTLLPPVSVAPAVHVPKVRTCRRARRRSASEIKNKKSQLGVRACPPVYLMLDHKLERGIELFLLLLPLLLSRPMMTRHRCTRKVWRS